MEKYLEATNKFLEKWKKKKEVIGALVCGSYVTGNPSKHSDIDLHIILSENAGYKERGNEYVDGFLVEYFANPISSHKEYLEEELEGRTKETIHMFLSGKVLFDKTGSLSKFISEVKKLDKKQFKPAKKGFPSEIKKYALWDMFDDLEGIYEKDSFEFHNVYYNFLGNVLWNYLAFLGFQDIPPSRVGSFFSEKKTQEKYRIPEFPDKEFVTLYLKAMKLESKENMMKNYKKLTKHCHNKMGFKGIDGWKVRTKLK